MNLFVVPTLSMRFGVELEANPNRVGLQALLSKAAGNTVGAIEAACVETTAAAFT
jgi:hypothetical protein